MGHISVVEPPSLTDRRVAGTTDGSYRSRCQHCSVPRDRRHLWRYAGVSPQRRFGSQCRRIWLEPAGVVSPRPSSSGFVLLWVIVLWCTMVVLPLSTSKVLWSTIGVLALSTSIAACDGSVLSCAISHCSPYLVLNFRTCVLDDFGVSDIVSPWNRSRFFFPMSGNRFYPRAVVALLGYSSVIYAPRYPRALVALLGYSSVIYAPRFCTALSLSYLTSHRFLFFVLNIP